MLKKYFIHSTLISMMAASSVFAAVSSTGEAASPKWLTGCSDGSWLFNSYSVQETDRHYFFSSSGQGLVSSSYDSFTLRNGSSWYVLDNRHYYESGIITVAFEKDRCTWSPTTVEIRCHSNQPLDVYVTRSVQDMGGVVELTSVFRVASVAAGVVNGTFTLEKADREGMTEGLEVRLRGPDLCRKSLVATAPDALVEFLSKK